MTLIDWKKFYYFAFISVIILYNSDLNIADLFEKF